jgi:hypothetical protein
MDLHSPKTLPWPIKEQFSGFDGSADVVICSTRQLNRRETAGLHVPAAKKPAALIILRFWK